MFDPTEFLVFAENLTRQRVMAEVDVRNAVSRAYYSVFLYTRKRLADRRLFTPTRSRDDHRLLVGWLRSQTREEVAIVGDVLDALRASRERADYDLLWEGARQEAIEAVLRARSVRDDIDRLFP
ncbi:MAG: HEPN domain-containing protein [Chloroflexi bacterium]|nr:HEPN domain-containing protein [Chloroflexota bacterium]